MAAGSFPLVLRSARHRSPRAVTAVAVVLLSVLTACDQPAVRLEYRPSAGTRDTYQLRVTTVSTTSLTGESSRTQRDSFALRVDHRVLVDAARVAVRLTGPGSGTRDFVVRLDRAGQLTSVETVEGLPASALGSLGLSEVFPASVTAPPARPLRPGDRWNVDVGVLLAGAPSARLVGRGRLAAVGVSEGDDLATVETDVSLPVDRVTPTDGGGTAHLVGTQRTRVRATHRLRDGVLRSADARTVGQYELTLAPPTPEGGPPVTGTLTVVVTSTTRGL